MSCAAGSSESNISVVRRDSGASKHAGAADLGLGLGLGPGLGDTNGPLAIVLSSTHSAASDWAGCGPVLSDVGEARTVLVEHAGEGLSSVQGTALSISGHLGCGSVVACLVFRLIVV